LTKILFLAAAKRPNNHVVITQSNTGNIQSSGAFNRPYFKKNNTGSDVFCTNLWGSNTAPPCYSLQGVLCLDNCTAPSGTYLCNTSVGVQQCDMNTCQESDANNNNYPQSNECMNKCRFTPCDGGNNYCNTLFLNDFYNNTSNLTNLTCNTGDYCFCRRGTYKSDSTDISSTQINSVVVNYFSFEQTFSTDLKCTADYANYQAQIYCNGNYSVSFNSVIGFHSFTNLNHDFLFLIPYSETLNSYTISVNIYPQDSPSQMFSFYVYARKPCDDVDCFMCSERFSTFSCMTTSGKWMFVLFILTVITVFLTVIYLIFWPILAGLLFCISLAQAGYTCGKGLCCCCYKRSKNKVKQYMEEGSDEEKGKLASSHGNRARSALPLALLAASSGVADACSTTPVITSLVPTCTFVNQNLTCSFNLNALITLSTAFDESCLNLKDSDGRPFADIRFNYGSFKYLTQTAFSYYTSDFVCVSQASKSCWTPSNWCGARCNNMVANDTTGQGQLSDPKVTTCPGITKCTRTCGCAGCGCFYCDAACTVFRWALNPQGLPYSVYQITGLTSVPNVTINVTIPGKPSTFLSVNPFPGILVKAGVFNVTQLGTFSNPTDLQLSTYGVVSNDLGTLQFFNPVAQKGTPLKLGVGDVQYYVRNQLTCGTTTGSLGTVFDPNIGVSGETSVTCTTSGISKLKPVPQLFNGYQVASSTASTVSFVPPTYPPIQIALSTGNLVLSQIVDYVCPVVEFVNITGCYQCKSGFQVLFNARSKCVSGAGLFSMEGCTPTTLFLNTSMSLLNISCQTNSSFFSGVLKVESNTDPITIDVSGALLKPTDSDSIFGSHSSSDVGSFSAGFSADFLTDTILGIPSTLGSLWKFIINLILIGVCIFAAYLLVRYVFPRIWAMRKSSSLSGKTDKEPLLPTSSSEEGKSVDTSSTVQNNKRRRMVRY
jgi:hypothetical protein